MSKIVTYHTNILESSTVTSTPAADASYPAYRLYDRHVGRKYQCGSSAPITIDINQGATGNTEIDTLIIPANHNLDGLICQLQYITSLSYTACDTGDFDETDVPGRFALTDATTVTITNLDNDEDVRLSQDMGAGFFSGNYDIRCKLNISKCTFNGGIGGFFPFMVVADANKSFEDLDAGGHNAHAVGFYNDGNDYSIRIYEIYNNTFAMHDESPDLSLSTDYYIHLKRDESIGTYGTIYVYIYSDSGFSTLVDTLSGTLRESSMPDMRYLFWGNNWDDPAEGGEEVSGTMENLEYRAWTTSVRWTQSDSLQIEQSFTAATKRYWQFKVGTPSSAIYFHELFLAKSYEWTRNPESMNRDMYPVYNIQRLEDAGGRPRYIEMGDKREYRGYKLYFFRDTHKTALEALNTAFAGKKPFYMKDTDGNLLYGELQSSLEYSRSGDNMSADFNFLEVLP